MSTKKNHPKTNESKVVTFIGGFYIFGSVVVLLSLIFGGSQLNTVFDLPQIPDYIVKIMTILFFVPAGYLYIQRSVIGYWMIMLSSILFFCISADLTTKFGTQPHIGNMMYALFVAIASFLRREEFRSSKQKP
jgi:hypothetical protein